MSTVKLEAELVDNVSAKAAKAARAVDRLAARSASAAQRASDKADKLARGDLINHARGLAKRERLEKKASARRVASERREAAVRSKRAEIGPLTTAAVGSFAGNFAVNAVSKMAELGVAAVKTGHDLAVAGENLEFAMGVQLTGSNTTADKALAHSDALAKRLGLSVEDTRRQYMALIDTAGSWGGAKAIDTTIRLGADLTRAGESSDGVAALTEAMNTIGAKGALTEKALKSLGGMGVMREHVYAALAKELGAESADAADLEKALGKKGLAADKAMPLIQNAILAGLGTTQAGEVAARYADTTIGGKEGRIRANAEGALMSGAGSARGKLHDAADATLRSTEGGAIQQATNLMGTVTAAAADAWADLLTIMDKDVGGWEKASLMYQRTFSTGAGDASTPAWLLAADAETAVTSGTNFDAGFAKGIDSGKMAEQAAKRLGQRASGALDTELKIFSPSRVTRENAHYTGQGFALGLEDMGPTVEAAAYEVADAAVIQPAAFELPDTGGFEAVASPKGGWFGGSGRDNPSTGARIKIDVHVAASDNAETTGRDIGRGIRGELDDYFESLVSEVA